MLLNMYAISLQRSSWCCGFEGTSVGRMQLTEMRMAAVAGSSALPRRDEGEREALVGGVTSGSTTCSRSCFRSSATRYLGRTAIPSPARTRALIAAMVPSWRKPRKFRLSLPPGASRQYRKRERSETSQILQRLAIGSSICPASLGQSTPWRRMTASGRQWRQPLLYK